MRDGDVVFGRSFERLDRQTPAHGRGQAARVERLEKIAVLFGMRQHRDVGEILGRGSQQRDAADVDLFDRFFQGHAVPRYRRLKRVEIHHHRVDRRNCVGFHLLAVSFVGALVKNRAEHLGVQGLYAPVEQRGEPGEVADVARRYAALGQKRLGAAGRIDDRAAPDERASQSVRTRFVRERKQGRCGGRFRQSRVPARTSAPPRPSSSRPVRAS